MKSDWSGTELAGGSAPAMITVRLPDGRQRELAVSADEVEKLAGLGRAVRTHGRILRRMVGFVKWPGWRPIVGLVKWAGVLFVASLLIPALTTESMAR